MKFTGKVASKTTNGEGQGHSQVRITAEVIVAGAKKPIQAEIIISSASAALVEEFKTDQAVTFTV